MVDATGLGGVVGDRAGRAAELVVEADAGGERAQAGGDAGVEVAGGAGAVAFECEQVFAGEEDRLDSLSDRGEVNTEWRLGLAGGPDDRGAELFDGGGELVSGVAFVADDRFAAAQGLRQQLPRRLAF